MLYCGFPSAEHAQDAASAPPRFYCCCCGCPLPPPTSTPYSPNRKLIGVVSAANKTFLHVTCCIASSASYALRFPTSH